MRAADLINKIEDRPFRPFRVHLSDGMLIDVREPGMTIVGLTSAVLPITFDRDDEGHRIARQWRTIALSHIVQFSDLEDSLPGPHASGDAA